MADNELDEKVEDNDELLTEEGESEEKKGKFSFSFSKPLLIKIAIGVVIVLLLAGGAYFFLMTDDEPLPKEAIATDSIEESAIENEVEDTMASTDDADVSTDAKIDMDNVIALPLDDSQEATTEKSDDSENSSSSEDLTNDQQLEQIRNDVKALQEENSLFREKMGELGIPLPQAEEPSGDKGDKEKNTSEKPVKNNYSDIYLGEERHYPEIRKAKQEPIPEPKWGK